MKGLHSVPEQPLASLTAEQAFDLALEISGQVLAFER
jgi:hypothetical protein